jgi:hypothetical protein
MDFLLVVGPVRKCGKEGWLAVGCIIYKISKAEREIAVIFFNTSSTVLKEYFIFNKYLN